MSVPVRDFLKARRDRALGSILGHAEREFWPKLTVDERAAFRRCVLDALNGYHDTALDLNKAEDGTVLRNDELLGFLQRIEAGVRGQRAPQPGP